MSTIQDDILDRIRGQGRGKVFTPKDFLDLARSLSENCAVSLDCGGVQVFAGGRGRPRRAPGAQSVNRS